MQGKTAVLALLQALLIHNQLALARKAGPLSWNAAFPLHVTHPNNTAAAAKRHLKQEQQGAVTPQRIQAETSSPHLGGISRDQLQSDTINTRKLQSRATAIPTIAPNRTFPQASIASARFPSKKPCAASSANVGQAVSRSPRKWTLSHSTNYAANKFGQAVSRSPRNWTLGHPRSSAVDEGISRRRLWETSGFPSCFVQAGTQNFTVCGQVKLFAGTNAYYLCNAHRPTDQEVHDFFQVQAARGVSVVRVFAFINGRGGSYSGDLIDYTPISIQPTVGVYNETALQRLDLLIYCARQNGIYLQLVLSNFYPALGGAQWYVDQVLGPGKGLENFYTNADVVAAFQSYIKMLVWRTNTLTGIRYREDPAIMAWDIMNEPATSPFYEYNHGMQPGSLINNWVWQISAFIKSQDPNHMVCLGEVGFPAVQLNYWGSSHPRNLMVTHIDFGSIHVYPEGWQLDKAIFSHQTLLAKQLDPFFEQGMDSARAAGKPLMLGEYGATPKYGSRDVVFQAIHAAANSRGLAATLVWQLTATPDAPGNDYNFGYAESGAFAMQQQLTYMATKTD